MAKRFKTKRKISWKKLISAIAVVVILLGSIAGIRACVKDETKTIGASAFSRGGLDENGKYVETDKSIYTKEVFACIGLRVEPDFESKVTFDVYYYDHDERFVSSKLNLSSVYDEDVPMAKYARIVIHPQVDEDEKDFKISLFDIRDYANDLKITVDKEQKYPHYSVDLYDESKVTIGKSFDQHGSDEYVTYFDSEYCKVTEEISITGEYKYFDIYVRRAGKIGMYAVSVVAADSDNKVIARQSFNYSDYDAGEWCKMTLEVPDNEADMYLLVRMHKESECRIFGYND